MLDYALRPLSDTSWVRDTKERPRKAPLFTASWDKMLDLLGTEIDHLGGYDVVIEIHTDRSNISNRGTIARGALLYSPAVIVGFETDDKGEMVFRCDEYRNKDWNGTTPSNVWRYNVYAVAKMLEALRAVERYGGESIQQYEGFKALPPGQSSTAVTAMTPDEAVAVLLEWSTDYDAWPFLPKDQERLVKTARRKTHPDMGGAQADWDRVDAAVQRLVTEGVLRGGS